MVSEIIVNLRKIVIKKLGNLSLKINLKTVCEAV